MRVWPFNKAGMMRTELRKMDRSGENDGQTDERTEEQSAVPSTLQAQFKGRALFSQHVTDVLCLSVAQSLTCSLSVSFSFSPSTSQREEHCTS